jgi:hypothetical protein
MALLNQTQQDYYDGNDFGGYQFTSLDDIINNFIIAYVGENKIIPKVKRTDVAFHAQRAIQELSFDTFKSIKSQEITLPPSNTMVLPQDYVNYTKVCWVDGNGIERPLYPTKHTSNPTPILQNSDGDYSLIVIGILNSVFNVVILDEQYLNIRKGMLITGPYIPDNTFVEQVNNTTAGGATSITMVDDAGASVTPVFPTGITSISNISLNIINEDKMLIIENETNVVVENLYWTSGTNKINTDTPSEISAVEVGMTISNTLFPANTKVLDVNETIGFIIVSEDATTTVTSTSTDDVTFHSPVTNSSTWDNYSSDTSNSTGDANGYNHDTDIYDLNIGQRYGVDPTMAQGNGTYYIDNLKGLIHFSSNISGKTVILKYISDGLGTDGEMVVHKFAEEAMYKSIAYAVLSTSISGQQLIPRFKKEKFAAIRQAKLRLSNLKIEELTQIMRGKSKWIKS